MQITATRRDALRKAVARTHRWGDSQTRAQLAALGVTSVSSIRKDQWQEVCRICGVDFDAVIRAADMGTTMQAVATATATATATTEASNMLTIEETQTIADRWGRARAGMTEKQVDFGQKILSKIALQGGRARPDQAEILRDMTSQAAAKLARRASAAADFADEAEAEGENQQHVQAQEQAATTAKPQAQDDDAAALARLIGKLAGSAVDEAAVIKIAQREVEKALRDAPTLRIEYQQDGLVLGAIEGRQHPAFSTLARVAATRQPDGFVPNVWIAGPTGSGKTTGARKLAELLGLPLYVQGAVDSAHGLVGYCDMGSGKYHGTPFRQAFEHGGVIVIDEVDAFAPDALLVLNSALANGMAAFPDAVAPIERHKDCIVLATANTWGSGATSDYVGRAKLDAAFLSRFPIRLVWDYDTALELALAGDQQAWALHVQAARRAARTTGLKAIICPRITIAGATLTASGFSIDEAADLTYRASLTPEQRRLLADNLQQAA